MTNLEIPLTESERNFVDIQAEKGGHGDAVRYIRSLIRLEQARQARLELEASLREALEGEATLMTTQDWADMRREAREMLAERAERKEA